MKLVHLVAFITKKSVTMHGHMNVKNKCCKVPQEYSACLTEFEVRGGEEVRRYKLPAPGGQEVCPGLDYVAYLCLSV